MPALSRLQLLVYAAAAVAVLLVGARWIRGAEGREAEGGGVAFASSSGGGEDAPGGGLAIEPGTGDVVVHVAGEVADPGVYELPSGARVTDAIERAGGATADAEVAAINLAALLADGQQIVVPPRLPGGAAAAAIPSEDGPISLGSATLEQLDTIEGIGPVTAQDILDYRDEQGGLSSVDELDQVSGIGPATMEALRDRLQP